MGVPGHPGKASAHRRRGTAFTVRLVALAGAWALGWPAAADATSIEPGFVVTDAANEANAMIVRGEPGELIFDDTGAVLTTTAPGCTSPTIHQVRCPSPGFVTLLASLGGGDDTFRLDDSSYTVATIGLASIDGGLGDDVLISGAEDQVLVGGAGDDTLDAGAGNDALTDFDGNDTHLGGPGRDRLKGGGGQDSLYGGDGPDVVEGQEGNDVELDGGAGDDDVRGGDGADIVAGGDGADRLEAPDTADPANEPGLGPDTVTGGPGNDRLSGGPGAGQLAADVFSGGGGEDIMEYEVRRSPVVVTLNGSGDDGAQGEGDYVQPDVESVIGGSDSDTLVGTDGPNVLDGGPGDDQLRGLGGDDALLGGVNDGGSDSLFGDSGSDTLTGGPGDDSLEGGVGGDPISGGGGSDTLLGGDGQDALAGGPGLDELQGEDGDDRLNGAGAPLVGADGADDLSGGAGDDELHGGAGNDRHDGGLGADRISGEGGRDAVSYEDRGAPITVTFDGEANDGAPDEGDNVLADIEIVLGGAVGDTLSGDARANVLDAGSGDDYLNGAEGPDRIAGGSGTDVLRARDGIRDLASCGGGLDLAIVDRSDTARDCEYVDRGRRRRPRLGRAALALPARGTVALRLPNASRFVPLNEPVRVPLGSTLDAHEGTVRVVTAKRRGGTVQEAAIYGGAFTVQQRRVTRPITKLRLRGGDFTSCRPSAPGRASVQARLGVRIARRPGRYRVRGRYSIGGSYGTIWWTEDRCDGTLTRVLRGTVRVRDFGRDRTVEVDRGERYLARSERRGKPRP
jgi:Ca2+-binding RTX toxin-like protein